MLKPCFQSPREVFLLALTKEHRGGEIIVAFVVAVVVAVANDASTAPRVPGAGFSDDAFASWVIPAVEEPWEGWKDLSLSSLGSSGGCNLLGVASLEVLLYLQGAH